jgi:hypothetical protein
MKLRKRLPVIQADNPLPAICGNVTRRLVPRGDSGPPDGIDTSGFANASGVRPLRRPEGFLAWEQQNSFVIKAGGGCCGRGGGA